MESFTDQLREWQIFYSTVSLASVTLAGLLFVSLSLHLEDIEGPAHTKLLRLARGSFGDFLYLLMLGLVFLVPHQIPAGLAIALFVLGATRGVGLFLQVFRERRLRGKENRAGQALREVALPALAAVGMLLVGAEVLRGDMLALYWLVLVVAALLASASWNAWLILVE